MISWPILKHPLNWAVVGSMALVTVYAIHLVLSHYHNEQP